MIHPGRALSAAPLYLRSPIWHHGLCRRAGHPALALRLQCYYPAADGSAQRGFAGIRWVASADLSDRLRRRVNRTFLGLGQALHRRRALGFANVDFMVDAGSNLHPGVQRPNVGPLSC